MTKTYVWAIVIIAVIAVIAFYQYSDLGGSGPRIEVTPAFYDFGDIPYELAEHTFSVKNTGDSVLEIAGISTSCGCTKGTIDRESIGPGETASLLVTIDPNLMEDDIAGEIERVVYVKSNDPGMPEIEIELSANIVR